MPFFAPPRQCGRFRAVQRYHTFNPPRNPPPFSAGIGHRGFISISGVSSSLVVLL
jgi:hypothetical protein